MPFTPFHFGHALPFIFSDAKKKRIDGLAALGGSIIVDIEPLIILFFNSNRPLHGPIHSFFFATILGATLGLLIHLLRNWLEPITAALGWKQITTLKSKIFWSTIMANIHVLLDSFLYPEMNPWLLWSGNPFLGLVSSQIIYQICGIGVIIGVVEFIIILIWQKTKKKKEPIQNYQK